MFKNHSYSDVHTSNGYKLGLLYKHNLRSKENSKLKFNIKLTARLKFTKHQNTKTPLQD